MLKPLLIHVCSHSSSEPSHLGQQLRLEVVEARGEVDARGGGEAARRAQPSRPLVPHHSDNPYGE
jgi:hypothetical protein